MIFISGGVYQGKVDFAKEKYNTTNVFDFKKDKGDFKEADILINFEYFIKDYFEETSVIQLLDEKIDILKDKIIIGNEIGSGVVPIDKYSRHFRDEVGRAYQYLTTNSTEVYRIWNGIPNCLKGESNE